MKTNFRTSSILTTLMVVSSLLSPLTLMAAEWEAVGGNDALTELFTDSIFEGTLKDGVKAKSIYNADGTGELRAWGDVFTREWKIEGDEQACILIDGAYRCFRLERNRASENEYRATNVETGESVSFIVSDQIIEVETGPANSSGGATQPSAEELAAKLANPTAPVMTIGNNIDYVTFDGDIPGAGDQSSFRYVFQTTFPFKLSNGGVVFFRPAIPVMFNEPVPDGLGGFRSVGTELGDTGFDFSYGKTEESGLLWGAGVVGTIPTATDDALGKDLWGLGPEVLLGVLGKWGAAGGILAHQWDVAGSGKGDIDLTSLTYFYAISLGGGWQVAAGPTISYDHTRVEDNWTIPLGIGLARTAVIGGRPWKFQVQYWNYAEAPNAYAPQHQVRFSVNPVVSAPWNDGR